MHVSQRRLLTELRAELDDVSDACAGHDVREHVPRARRTAQPHDAGTVAFPSRGGVGVVQHEINHAIFGRENRRTGTTSEVNASVPAGAIGTLGQPRATSSDGRTAANWKASSHVMAGAVRPTIVDIDQRQVVVAPKARPESELRTT